MCHVYNIGKMPRNLNPQHATVEGSSGLQLDMYCARTAEIRRDREYEQDRAE